MGVSGMVLGTGVVGVVSMGVPEEDRDAEGSEMMRLGGLAVLRWFIICVKF